MNNRRFFISSAAVLAMSPLVPVWASDKVTGRLFANGCLQCWRAGDAPPDIPPPFVGMEWVETRDQSLADMFDKHPNCKGAFVNIDDATWASMYQAHRAKYDGA